ncbi:MAG: molybdopterin-dependent oxidoreductase [Janthinobacterium lividum]
MSKLPSELKSYRQEIINAAESELKDASRRRFLGNALTLGSLSMISGVALTNEFSVEKMLKRMSQFNDGAQGFLFNSHQLAPTYPESMITRPFPFNAYYDLDKVPHVDGDQFLLEVTGLVDNKTPWTLAQLNQLPQTSQITRHICVEGWSAIGNWGGIVFSEFLKRIGADTTAKYIAFKCADDYFTSIDMATALHPQTLLTFRFDNKILPARYGFPMKLRMPTKLGYKNPKHITSITITNVYSSGYWEEKNYNWFGGS